MRSSGTSRSKARSRRSPRRSRAGATELYNETTILGEKSKTPEADALWRAFCVYAWHTDRPLPKGATRRDVMSAIDDIIDAARETFE